MRRQSVLPGDRRCDRVLRPRERDEERVALRVDHLSPDPSECLAKNSLVLGESSAVRLTEALEQPGRSLDVREEEGDRSPREVARHARLATRVLRGRFGTQRA
jgi:hypothetical protein